MGTIQNLNYLERLNLGNNMFIGNIPSNVGMLHNLKQALFHYNKFDGIMPKEICNLTIYYNLFMLHADCLNNNNNYDDEKEKKKEESIFSSSYVSCDCCTDCCDRIENVCFTV